MAGYLRWKRAPVLSYLDAGASCAGLGIFVARWSCFLAGDDFGRITALPWGISYPPGSHAFDAHVSAGILPPSAALSLPTHPVQLYLGFTALLVFGVASRIWNRWHLIPGLTLSAFLALDASTRFWWESLRDAAAGEAKSFLSNSQWMCLVFLVAGLVIGGSRALRVAAGSGIPKGIH
jgi:phosphatidylglycerol:prolipoprotein diacylglycerol transferase